VPDVPLLRLEQASAAAKRHDADSVDYAGLRAQLSMIAHSLARSGKAASETISALVAEGCVYARTPNGERWLSVLRESSLVSSGCALWNAGNLDVYFDTAAPMHDPPASYLGDILARLDADAGRSKGGG